MGHPSIRRHHEHDGADRNHDRRGISIPGRYFRSRPSSCDPSCAVEPPRDPAPRRPASWTPPSYRPDAQRRQPAQKAALPPPPWTPSRSASRRKRELQGPVPSVRPSLVDGLHQLLLASDGRIGPVSREVRTLTVGQLVDPSSLLPGGLAAEIAESLEAALQRFRAVATHLFLSQVVRREPD